MRIDPRRFLELLVLLMICLWLTLICLNGFPKAYGGYAVSMLQWCGNVGRWRIWVQKNGKT